MTLPADLPCTAFIGNRLFASGPLAEVALAIRAVGVSPADPVLLFDDRSGRSFDIDTRGSEAEVLARLAPAAEPGPAEQPRGRGRPRLGVIAREVTLLPRHWDWLTTQPGGASVTLRKLIDDARRNSGDTDRRRAAQDATYHFMSAMAGDLSGFEEAARALYAGDAVRFESELAPWPADVRAHAQRLAAAAFGATSHAA